MQSPQSELRLLKTLAKTTSLYQPPLATTGVELAVFLAQQNVQNVSTAQVTLVSLVYNTKHYPHNFTLLSLVSNIIM